MTDPHFRVAVLARTPNPQALVWHAMHQCYSEGFSADDQPPSETEAGNIAVKRLLAGGRGHYGPLEHPQITFNVGGFPHSVMQQARTHRVGVSFDVQSGRYTGERVRRITQAARCTGVDDVFYLRPPGFYTDRNGKKYEYKEHERDYDRELCYAAACRYSELLRRGFSEEHARSILPFDIRQNFVVSFNLRSAFHFLDLRGKADAQLEIQQLCNMMWPLIKEWAPEISAWYETNRLGKGRLAP